MHTKKGRFLIEVVFPNVSVQFRGKNHVKQLIEEDIRYLVATQFAEWKNFVITRHFRLELDIGHEQPLPRIAEEGAVDEEGGELGEQSEPHYLVPEEEKPQLEAARNRINSWFPN